MPTLVIEDVAGGGFSAKTAGKAEKGEKKLLSVEIEQSANGGFAIEHRYRMVETSAPSMHYCEPETFTFESWSSALAHLTGLFSGGKSEVE